MRKFTWKWVAWTTTIVCILILIGSFVTVEAIIRRDAQFPERLLHDVIGDIQTNGISTTLPDTLENLPRPKGWRAYYVQEDSSWDEHNGYGRIVAAYPKQMVGATGPTIGGYSTGFHVTTPSGMKYIAWYLYEPNSHQALFDVLTILGEVAMGLAWLMLALGVFLEARERGSRQPYAWLLLAMATGPAGLAAWLISRPAKLEPVICPGCGAEPPKDATFCVTCGHGLRPACPECRRSVQEEWLYCGTCGTNLTE